MDAGTIVERSASQNDNSENEKSNVDNPVLKQEIVATDLKKNISNEESDEEEEEDDDDEEEEQESDEEEETEDDGKVTSTPLTSHN